METNKKAVPKNQLGFFGFDFSVERSQMSEWEIESREYDLLCKKENGAVECFKTIKALSHSRLVSEEVYSDVEYALSHADSDEE